MLSRTGMTDANGWFVVCGVPTASSVIVRAVSGTDTSGAIEFDVPKSRIARTQSLRRSSARLRTVRHDLAHDSRCGAGRAEHRAVLTGWVRTEDGVPIPGARVRCLNSDVVATTNDDGAFQLVGHSRWYANAHHARDRLRA